eukprot:COSAG02_NODE_6799_length_3354_cov_92.971619_2_plen_79_part_00
MGIVCTGTVLTMNSSGYRSRSAETNCLFFFSGISIHFYSKKPLRNLELKSRPIDWGGAGAGGGAAGLLLAGVPCAYKG